MRQPTTGSRALRLGRTPFLRHLVVLLVLALAAAACATDDTTDDDTPAPTPDTDTDATSTPAGDDEVDTTQRGDGTLRLGYLLPETGQLAFLGGPMIAAVEMAVADINEAGGVLGNDVLLDGADEAGDAGVASSSASRLLSDGVDAIIGAAASGMSLAVIDQVTNAGVVQCSPSNTSPTFTDYDDGGFYFRSAPTDALQGPVLAETIVDDGYSQVAILARADDYGQGFADATEETLEEAGAEVVAKVIYDPEAATFDSEVQQIAAEDPDAIVIIAFDESAQILASLIEADLGPDQVALYGGESVRSSDRPSEVDPSDETVIDGLKGTAPVSRADDEFVNRLQEFGDVEDTLFAGEAYDCVMVIALAAVAADSDDPEVFVDEMINVTRDGTDCDSFEDCVALLEDGEDINYNGASGPLQFSDAGEPTRGVYEIWEFQDGEIVALREVEISSEGGETETDEVDDTDTDTDTDADATPTPDEDEADDS